MPGTAGSCYKQQQQQQRANLPADTVSTHTNTYAVICCPATGTAYYHVLQNLAAATGDFGLAENYTATVYREMLAAAVSAHGLPGPHFTASTPLLRPVTQDLETGPGLFTELCHVLVRLTFWTAL